jgi:hypothetical protein
MPDEYPALAGSDRRHAEQQAVQDRSYRKRI